MSKRFALAAVLGASLIAVPAVAYAAEDPDPQVVQVQTAVACGTVTVTLANLDVGGYGFVWTTGPFDGGLPGESGRIDVAAGATTTHTIRLPEDSFAGRGFVTLGVAYGPNTHRQAFLDLGLVVTDCAPPAEDPDPTELPSPSATPDPTTPAPTSTPALPPAGDEDGDFDQVGGTPPVGGIATGG